MVSELRLDQFMAKLHTETPSVQMYAMILHMYLHGMMGIYSIMPVNIVLYIQCTN